jgi:phage-related protein
MGWKIEFLDERVKAELDSCPADIRARFEWIVRLIRSHGLENVRYPYVAHLDGPAWEIRMTGKDGIARALYVTARSRRVVIVRVFVKKTQKTPRREIVLALARAKDVK